MPRGVTTAAPGAYKRWNAPSCQLAPSALCACAAAGCGGSSIEQAARQEAKELLGDPHARVVRVETVQIVNGTREAIVPMQGHFTVHPDCPAAVGGKASRCHTIHSRYAVLDFNPWNPRRARRATGFPARCRSP